jgi:hypothetical protein
MSTATAMDLFTFMVTQQEQIEPKSKLTVNLKTDLSSRFVDVDAIELQDDGTLTFIVRE